MTKKRNTKNLVKSEPFFNVHLQYLSMFLIDLYGLKFRGCRIFHCFVYVLKNQLDYHRFLSFICYPLVIVLQLKSF